MRFNVSRARGRSLALLLAAALVAAPAAAAVSNDELARYADQLFSQT